jgi:hypothetical protein
MTKDEALQMCLEYIETDAHERKYVRHAIKEALAKQEQGEPVAWISPNGNIHFDPWLDSAPLYTTPPQRKPLTDEQIMGIARITCIGISPHEDTLNFVKAIEAAHGIKE